MAGGFSELAVASLNSSSLRFMQCLAGVTGKESLVKVSVSEQEKPGITTPYQTHCYLRM